MVELGYASVHFSPTRVTDPPPLPDQVEAAAAAGFTFATLDRNTLRVMDETEGDLRGLAATCEELLPCRELMALFLTADQAALDEQVDRMTRHASIFAPEVITVLINTEPEAWILDWLGGAADKLAQVVPGVKFGIEVSPLFPVATIIDGRRVIDALGRSDFGLIIDSWHFFHGGRPWGDLRSMAAEEIAIVHFSDHGELGPEGFKVERNRRELPGLGVFDLDRFVETVLETGYAGGVTAEVVSERLRGLSATEYAEAVFAASAPYWLSQAAT